MTTQQDQDFATRLGHVAMVSESPAAITSDKKWFGTITLVHEGATAAKETLDKAVTTQHQDHLENSAAMLEWQSTIGAAAQYVGWLHDDIRHHYLDVSPEAPQPTPAQSILLMGLLATFMTIRPSELSRQRPTTAKNHIDSIHAAVEKHPEWVTAEQTAKVKEYAQLCAAALKQLIAEGLDDDQIMDNVFQARDTANRTMVAARSILSGILTMTQSPMDLDELILTISRKKKNQETVTTQAPQQSPTPTDETPNTEVL